MSMIGIPAGCNLAATAELVRFENATYSTGYLRAYGATSLAIALSSSEMGLCQVWRSLMMNVSSGFFWAATNAAFLRSGEMSILSGRHLADH